METENRKTDMRPVTLIFILTCIVYVYPYLIYPFILRILMHARKDGRKPEEPPIQSMTHIICAHNEEQHIQLKLTNAFEMAAALVQQVLLVCDGCTDRTPEIARGIAARNRSHFRIRPSCAKYA